MPAVTVGALRGSLVAGFLALASGSPWEASSLLDFVPAATQQLSRPNHLAPLAAVFEDSEHAPVFALASTPPQHGKSTLVAHALVWLMLRHPGESFGYITYQNGKAYQVSREAQWIAERLGLRPEGTLHKWRLPNGSTCVFTGIGGSLTGEPISRFLVVDDPHKDRAEAESPVIRQRIYDWYKGVALDRLHPTASVLVISTRWHVADLYGTLLEDDPARWRRVNLPALVADGTPLWSSARSVDWLLQKRRDVGEYEWWSKWMGEPRPRGSNVFRDVHYYDSLPDQYRVGVGADMAYTAKTSSSYSSYVVLACDSRGELPVFYVLDVARVHEDPPAFRKRLAALKARYPGALILWYTSSTERGLADLLRKDPDSNRSIPIIPVVATADKFVRAQPFAAAWNDGRVLLPSAAYLEREQKSADWIPEFVSEVCSFTGVGDASCDQVDAGAAAHDLLAKTGGKIRPRAVKDKFTGPLVVADKREGEAELPDGFVWG